MGAKTKDVSMKEAETQDKHVDIKENESEKSEKKIEEANNVNVPNAEKKAESKDNSMKEAETKKKPVDIKENASEKSEKKTKDNAPNEEEKAETNDASIKEVKKAETKSEENAKKMKKYSNDGENWQEIPLFEKYQFEKVKFAEMSLKHFDVNNASVKAS